MIKRFLTEFKALPRKDRVIIVLSLCATFFIVVGFLTPSPQNAASVQSSSSDKPAETAKPQAPSITHESLDTTAPVAFTTEYREDASSPQGQQTTVQTGHEGVTTTHWDITKKDGVETARVQKSSEVTTAPANTIISRGTRSACNVNYTPCVPNSATDLDCPDIGHSVHVVGVDVYRLDADHDGTGCDSYR